MDMTLAIAFWGVSFLFTLTPGADWAYAISSGLRRGGVVPAVSGMLTGHFTATLVVAAGVAAILAASGVAMTVLMMAGALYLVWLGVSALRQRSAVSVGAAGGAATADGPGGTTMAGTGAIGTGAIGRGAIRTGAIGTGAIFAKGVGVSLLNPKVLLLFLALLPQFTSREAPWPVGGQMIALGAVHLLSVALVYFAVGYGASRVLASRPRAARIVGIVSGVVMVALGAVLVAEQVVVALL